MSIHSCPVEVESDFLEKITLGICSSAPYAANQTNSTPEESREAEFFILLSSVR